MRRNLTRICSLVTASAVILSLLAGCGKQGEKKETTDTGAAQEGNLLPVKSPVTLKYWAGNNVPTILANYSEIAMYKELEKRTGVKIEFIHPAAGQEKEVFNMMLASGDLPDLIENINASYSGGLSKAFADGVIVDMKPLMDKYAPNITDLYKTYPELKMTVETLDGQYFVAPWVKGSNAIRVQNGLIMRKDLLADVGKKVPTNVKEFEEVLQAFKDKGVKVPLSIDKKDIGKDIIGGMFGVYPYEGFMVENGKVNYWASSPNFKEYVTTLARWYEKGLIDKEFSLNTSKVKEARITSGETGVFASTAGSGFLKYLEPGKKSNPKYDLIGVPFLNPKFTLVDDFSSTTAGAVSIFAANKNKNVTMAWIDYLYGKEGNLLANFGTEGESYTMVNGVPTFTDLIVKNPEGKAMSDIGRKYARSFGSAAMVQDKRYGDQFWSLPQQIDALATWSKSVDETVKAANKVYGELSPEESQSIASKNNDITTYVDEMILKFIMGVEPVSKLDEFQAQLKKMGIDEITKLHQNAHDKFLVKFPDAKNPRDIEISDYYIK